MEKADSKNDSSMNKELLGDRVKKLCNIVGVNPNTLDKDFGNTRFVYNITANRIRNPHKGFFEYMQAVFNANPVWLKTGNGEMFIDGKLEHKFPIVDSLHKLEKLSENEQQMIWYLIDKLLASKDKDEFEPTANIDPVDDEINV